MIGTGQRARMDLFIAHLRALAPEPRWRRMSGKIGFPIVAGLEVFWTEGMETVEAEVFEAGGAKEGFVDLYEVTKVHSAEAAAFGMRIRSAGMVLRTADALAAAKSSLGEAPVEPVAPQGWIPGSANDVARRVW